MHDDDDTKTPAPLTPEEEQAMRTIRPWYGLLRLFATLDEVRGERDALQVDLDSVRELLRAAREERDVAEQSAENACDAEARAELDAAWHAWAVWSCGTGPRNIHLCQDCSDLPRFRRLKRQALARDPRLVELAEQSQAALARRAP